MSRKCRAHCHALVNFVTLCWFRYSRMSFRTSRSLSSPVDPTVQRYRPARPVSETIVRFEPRAKPAARQAKPAEIGAASGARAELPSTVSKVPSLHDGIVAVREIGGRKDGTEPTRYGDWEKNGR